MVNPEIKALAWDNAPSLLDEKYMVLQDETRRSRRPGSTQGPDGRWIRQAPFRPSDYNEKKTKLQPYISPNYQGIYSN